MDLLLHQNTKAQLTAITLHSGGTFLLHGQAGTGKMTAAREVARKLNCSGCKDQTCRNCQMVRGGNHPDVLWVKPDEKNKIGIERIQQLQHDLRYKQYEVGSERVVIICQADAITLPAQNALLKTLEEPPVGTTIILTATTVTALLPTVLSRCSGIHFPPIANPGINTFLQNRRTTSKANIEVVVELSHGSVGKALTLLENSELFERQQVFASNSRTLLSGTEDLLDRLHLASSISSDAENRGEYVQTLIAASRKLARENTSEGSYSLKAVERLQQRLAANVAPKTAFEALAVEVA